VLPVGTAAAVGPGTRVIAHWRPEDQVLVSQ